MENKIFTAIDIGTTKIVVVRGKSIGNHKIEITDMGMARSLGIQRGIVKNVEETATSVAQAIGKLSSVDGVENDVWVGIAGQHVRSTLSSVRTDFDNENHILTISDIEKLCHRSFQANLKPGEKIVNISPQSFEVKSGLYNDVPIGEATDFISSNLHLTIAQESAFKSIDKVLKTNGLKSKEIVLESIASAKSVLTKEEMTQGVALIDIGGGTSDIAIFKNGTVVHSAVVPFGGEVITSDIQSAFELDYRYAESLKHEYGYILKTEGSDRINLKNMAGQKIKIKQKDLSFVIKARMEEIIGLIKFQFELCGCANELEKGIVLTGGGALLKDIMQYFAYSFKNIPLRLGRPNQQYIGVRTENDMNSPLYATATGLLLFGIQSYLQEKVNQEQNNAIEQSNSENKKPQEKKEKGSIFDSLRGRIKNIFNEEDQKF